MWVEIAILAYFVIASIMAAVEDTDTAAGAMIGIPCVAAFLYIVWIIIYHGFIAGT